ncbi:MAG: diaminopimelate epimerase [Acidobacteriota bacterium]
MGQRPSSGTLSPSFYKLSGAGNDFIARVEPREDPAPGEVRAWCRRGLSIGADGILVLRKGPDSESPVRMQHWNADGSPSDLCLNGSRCAVQLAHHLGWHQNGRVILETAAGPLDGRRLDGFRTRVRIPWRIEPPQAASLETPLGTFAGYRLAVGVPHFVLATAEPVDDFDLDALGPTLRHHEDLGPEGANVEVIRWRSSELADQRSWERGVEGETLACGTGAIAAVRVGLEIGALRGAARVRTRGGFDLEVELEIEADGRARGSLCGDARIVARGEILEGAAGAP